ncbi:MAG: protein kinase [Pirellulaceae bacterium]
MLTPFELEQHVLAFDQAIHNEPEFDVQRYLASLPSQAENDGEENRVQLIIELSQVEMDFRWQAGKERFAEDYLNEFPELDAPELKESLVRNELSARATVGRLPEDAELQNRAIYEPARWKQLLVEYPVDDRAQVKITVSQSLIDDAKEFGVGDRLGRFELSRVLGRGAFSTVFLAHDPELDRQVAVKLIRPTFLSDASMLARTMREAQATASLHHPGIVQVYEYHSTDSAAWIVEQFIDGQTLADCLAKKKFDVREYLSIVRDVASAVHVAHENGIVHRDIKPANILIDKNGRPHLTDFGLALINREAATVLTQDGDLLGTPAYMSPEQVSGTHTNVTRKADVYGIGVVLFECCTGQLPFCGSAMSVMHRIAHAPVPPPRRFNPSIDKDLDTIILRCLDKDPNARPSTAEFVADELQRILNGEPIQSRRTGALEKVWKWTIRRPKVAALIGLVALLTAFLFGTLFQLNAVQNARLRAELAEQENSKLLARSAADAGSLAMQRGQIREAIRHFQTSLDLDDSDDQVWLGFVSASIANRNYESAREMILSQDVKQLPADLRGEFFLHTAELAETGISMPISAIEALDKALECELASPRFHYVQALHADNSLTVVDELRESLRLDPLQYGPRRMLVTMLLSLARFDELESELSIARQLFPDSEDFGLLQAVSFSIRNEIERARETVTDLKLSTDDEAGWLQMVESVGELRQQLSHYSGQLSFDEAAIKLIATRIEKEIIPALQARQIYFPPGIAERFEELSSQLNSFILLTGDLDAFHECLREVVVVHPEASIMLLTGSYAISTNNLGDALQWFYHAAETPGFVSDSETVAWDGIFALTRVLATRESDRRLEHQKAMVEAVQKFDELPQLLAKYSTDSKRCHAIVVGLIEAMQDGQCSEILVNAWLERAEKNDLINGPELVWGKILVAQHARNWSRVIELCDALETIDPNAEQHNETGRIGARQTANEEVAKILGVAGSEDSDSF